MQVPGSDNAGPRRDILWLELMPEGKETLIEKKKANGKMLGSNFILSIIFVSEWTLSLTEPDLPQHAWTSYHSTMCWFHKRNFLLQSGLYLTHLAAKGTLFCHKFIFIKATLRLNLEELCQSVRCQLGHVKAPLVLAQITQPLNGSIQSCNKSVSWYLGYRTFLEENTDIFK